MKEPKFWYDPALKINFIQRFFLWVFSRLFELGAFFKLLMTPTKSVSKPVICIGNFTVGGAGKTPTTLAIAHYFKEHGKNIAIISRGYKGKLTGPLRVDRTCHSAQDVGDEPLLMAHYFPTWISANRYEGAQQAIKKGADIILLDDGLQHHTLKQDLKICVLNTTQKFGNQHVMPLGPLRENLKKGLERVDALVALQNTPTPPLALTTTKPLLKAKISLNAADCRALKKKALFAFAGLAHPGKFFDTLRLENLNLEKTQAFPDHYPYSTNDLKTLVTEAQKHNRHLVTTEKDWVRLPKEFQDQILSLRINVTFQNHAQLDDLLAPFLKEKK